jgi:hypothetical protein
MPPQQMSPPGWGPPAPPPRLGPPAYVAGSGGAPPTGPSGPVLAAGMLLLLLAGATIYPLADAIRIMADSYDDFAGPAALMLGPIPVTSALVCAAAAAVIGGVGLLRARPAAAWPAWSGCGLILLYFWLQAGGGIERWWNSAEHGVVVATTVAAALTVPVGILLVTGPARRFARRARPGAATAAAAVLSVLLVYQLACLVVLGGIQALDRDTSGIFTVSNGWYAATTAVLGVSAVLLLIALPALLAGYAWARFLVWVSAALTVGLLTAAAVGSPSWDWSDWNSWTLTVTLLGVLPLAVAILAATAVAGTAGALAGGTVSGGGWPAAAAGSTAGSGGAGGTSAGVGAALAALVATTVVFAGVGVGAGVGLAAGNSSNAVASDDGWNTQPPGTPYSSYPSYPYYPSYPSYPTPTYSPPSQYPSPSPSATGPTHPSGGPAGSESAYDALDAYFSDFQQAVRYDDSTYMRSVYDKMTPKGRHYLEFDHWTTGYAQTTDISDWTYDSAEATGTGLRIYLRWTSRQSAGPACLRYTGTMDVVPDGDSYLIDGWNVSASNCS